jgi:ABC-type bacteriocin/lantibiotic exporter with double-glycine peptidase domain
MVLVTNNWRLWAIGMAASLAIFVVVFFAVIKPSTDTANQAIKTGIQQSQQVINQAKKQLNSSGASGAVSSQANQQLDKASKLTSCVGAAGTDPSKLASCQSQYGG